MNIKINKKLTIYNICAILLGFIAQVYLNLLENKIFFPINIIKLVILEILFVGGTNILYFKGKIIGKFAFKYRYLIAVFLIIICTIFQINGSSIGVWENTLLGNGQENSGVIFGRSRGIRSDEWNVNTMMAFSKYYDDFSYFSKVLMGGGADNFIVYGQPTKDMGAIFRPFLLGYLFLDSGYGLSFFWSSRLIILFLISFEMLLILTNKNKLLSLTGAFMIAFAPIVQWWFAINGLVEMLIFGQLAIILLDKYMKEKKKYLKLLDLIGMAICAGGYVLTFYPAWMIPLFYVFFGIAIWVIIKNAKEFKFDKIDLIQIAIVLIVFGAIGTHILIQSKDTIKTILNTVYPGKRVDSGGGNLYALFEYFTNIFFPLKESGVPINVCENARFFDLFPLGLILTIIVWKNQKGKKDLLLKILFIISLILGYYCIFGVPSIIAKISLLSFSTANRAFLAFGFVNVLILLRAISIYNQGKDKLSFKNILTISLITTFIVYMQIAHNFLSYTNYYGLVIICILAFSLFYLILNKNEKVFSIVMIFVMLESGLLVNPIRVGANVVYDNEISQKINEIASKDSNSSWILEGNGLPNILIANGAKTINSTNVYPMLDRWHLLDENKEYEDVYNRYAHITIKLYSNIEQYKSKFELLTPDSIQINLIPTDLEKLDIKYILTKNDLEVFNNSEMEFTKVFDNGYKIYEIKNE